MLRWEKFVVVVVAVVVVGGGGDDVVDGWQMLLHASSAVTAETSNSLETVTEGVVVSESLNVG